jgi:hypothetical protein
MGSYSSAPDHVKVLVVAPRLVVRGTGEPCRKGYDSGTVTIPSLETSILPGLPSPPQSATQSPTNFSIGWLLANASPSLQYRSLVDVAHFDVQRAPKLAALPYLTQQGLQLAMSQSSNGAWGAGMLTVPKGPGVVGAGTIPAYRRLLELGWDPESPTLAATRRLLFRLLAEDEDPSYLGELGVAATDDILIRRGRLMLREAAAAALAQAGYESDPRLRGAARRLVDKLAGYLKSPLAQKPFVRIGNQHVLPAEVAAPSFHLLVMLAHMPYFRGEHQEAMDRLYTYLSQPWPRQTAVQQVGPHLLEQPHLVLGDLLPTRNAMDADMPSSLAWLEIMARLGYLRRNEGWMRLVDRLQDDRDRHGVWRVPRSVVMPAEVPSWSWPTMPLTNTASADESIGPDVTFRLGLIARLSGRGVDLV